MKFVIFTGISGAFYWRLVARNGRILAHSEGYTKMQSVRKTVDNLNGQFKEPLPVEELL